MNQRHGGGEGEWRRPFGTLPDGRAVTLFRLADDSGLSAEVLTLGASLHALRVPDRQGRTDDIVLGHATLAEYLEKRQYFGATVGRVANRIAGGRFTLDGREHRVPTNDGANSLHGGETGFDRIVWEPIDEEPGRMVSLGHVSPDGDQGFPGRLEVSATYRLGERLLSLEYRATADRPTIVNLSNHVYWNLAGEGSEEGAMGHLLTIPAEHYLPTDQGAIPTGEFRPVAGTPFDFRTPTAIGARVRDASDAQIRIGRGYDHNWVIDRSPSAEPRLLARLEHPGSGRVLETWSNMPGLQFYSGNFLDGTSVGKSGRLHRMGDAVALEPQMFPDTPNRPSFGSLRLEPGETYRHLIVWRFPPA